MLPVETTVHDKKLLYDPYSRSRQEAESCGSLKREPVSRRHESWKGGRDCRQSRLKPSLTDSLGLKFEVKIGGGLVFTLWIYI